MKQNRLRQRVLKYLQLTDMYNFIREAVQAEQQLCNCRRHLLVLDKGMKCVG